jgi:hypothetical protein
MPLSPNFLVAQHERRKMASAHPVFLDWYDGKGCRMLSYKAALCHGPQSNRSLTSQARIPAWTSVFRSATPKVRKSAV